MFLYRSWPIRGGAADIYNKKIYINEMFYLKKNLNAPRPFLSIPQSGTKKSKRLGGIIGGKNNTKPLHGIYTGSP